ncbi:MAG: tRNA uridine(34) 5-carboxymethylaminomethyl modification radical SAM/GNAT enzyme Elp3 [Patescibacteria group bacterium]
MSTFNFDPAEFKESLLPLLNELVIVPDLGQKGFYKIVRKHQRPDGNLFSKDQILSGYRYFVDQGILRVQSHEFLQKLQTKPVRTASGVTPVTVLTKPFPCPGKCIFCPNDIRMPKSYLSDEPGAQRAERNQFDPYLQAFNRLQAFKNIGHSIDKVEIIILGGTWSFYPEEYQIWFIKRCFDALNDFGAGRNDMERLEKLYQTKNDKLEVESRTRNEKVSKKIIDGETLERTYNQVISELYTAPDKLLKLDSDQTATWAELELAHKENETTQVRCVGLVIETRPDNISEAEVLRIRRLGCTKTQIGIQSLQDEVLEKNKRGHDVAATRRAFALLRQAGFKIHAHWMPNLYGSSPEKDIEDYKKLFSDDDFKPDELKIYPCSLISSAELMQYYKKDLWHPYTDQELSKVLTESLMLTPEYCRLTRVIRDIPSTDIVVGNKKTNYREIAEKSLADQGLQSKDIRAREIKSQQVSLDDLHLDEIHYSTSVSDEVFIQFITKERKIAGFLRLSLPKRNGFIEEIHDSAMIREVHVYGQTTQIGEAPTELAGKHDKAQHLGLGKRLIERAKELASEAHFNKLQVISAIGTREYYRKQGFQDGTLYQYIELS